MRIEATRYALPLHCAHLTSANIMQSHFSHFIMFKYQSEPSV